MQRVALFIVFAILFPANLPAQVTSHPLPPNTGKGLPLPPVKQDAQATELLNQSITVAGGLTTLVATKDYTASGTITYQQGQSNNVQGTVTVTGRQFGSVRMDEVLPMGSYSEIIGEPLTLTKDAKGVVTRRHVQGPMNPSSLVLPYFPIRSALSSKNFNLLYKGQETVNGQSVIHVRIQRGPLTAINPKWPASDFATRDYYLDPSTSQIVMTQDTDAQHNVRQVYYSNYTLVNGVLVPFSITLNFAGQQVWTIQLQQVSFNAGLADSNFTF